MKVNHNQYVCDRCGKKIRPNQKYDLCPECDKYLEKYYGLRHKYTDNKKEGKGGVNNAKNETT